MSIYLAILSIVIAFLLGMILTAILANAGLADKKMDELMVKEKLKIKFLKFLKENKALDSWLAEIKRAGKNSSDIFKREPAYWLGLAFNWDKTQRGENYWANLYTKWIMQDH